MDNEVTMNGEAPPATAPEGRNVIQEASGSRNSRWGANLLNRTLGTLADHGMSKDDKTARDELIGLTIDTLAAFAPTDPIEGMLAAQATAMHHASMECFRRAMNPEQPHEIAVRCRKDGANLARGVADMLDALARHRGKSTKQVVRVERVVVQDGGQAIVGAVATGGGRG